MYLVCGKPRKPWKKNINVVFVDIFLSYRVFQTSHKMWQLLKPYRFSIRWMNSNFIDFLNLFRQNLIRNYVYFFGLPTHPSPRGPVDPSPWFIKHNIGGSQVRDIWKNKTIRIKLRIQCLTLNLMYEPLWIFLDLVLVCYNFFCSSSPLPINTLHIILACIAKIIQYINVKYTTKTLYLLLAYSVFWVQGRLIEQKSWEPQFWTLRLLETKQVRKTHWFGGEGGGGEHGRNLQLWPFTRPERFFLAEKEY